MIGPPPSEQLPFLFNTAASPKFAAPLKSISTWNFGSCVESGIRFRISACTGITISIKSYSQPYKNQLESNPLLIEIQFGAMEIELETQFKLASFKLRLSSMENEFLS